MSLPVLYSNNVKIYNVTGLPHHHLPDWLARRHTKKLKKDEEYSRRVHLLQDFEFPEASLRLALTPDQRHLVVTGVYPPQFRVFEMEELALKFTRHTTSETVRLTILGDGSDSDWRKMVLLQADRNVEFHGSSGLYHTTRIPRAGRDMIYDEGSAELLLVGSGSEVFRLNLDRGQFMAPLEMRHLEAINCVRMAPHHGIYALGGEGGWLEFWDRRDRSARGVLSISTTANNNDDDGDYGYNNDNMNSSSDITALCFLPDGVHWTAGTGDGRVLLFDLRLQDRPLRVVDHHNGLPIHKIEYDSTFSTLLTADRRSIRLWQNNNHLNDYTNQKTSYSALGKLFCTVESESDINDFVLQPGTGLIMVANEASPVASYFIPQLGPAPRWCSFLERLTEEMEEKTAAEGSAATVIYDNFKFITRSELAQLGLDHLIGSRLLRPHLHGFFINLRLYEQARAIANPFAHEEWLARQRKERLERERQSRIRTLTGGIEKTARVNRGLATKLAGDRDAQLNDVDGSSGDKNKKSTATAVEGKKLQRAKEVATNILGDERFADLFRDPAFEIDSGSIEYRMLHPQNQNRK